MTPCLKGRYLCHSQSGAALLVMLTIIILGSMTFLLASLNSSALQNSRDKITADALAQAKEALIAYATTVVLTSTGSRRPGDLPCPDLNNDGVQENSCGNASGSTGQAARLGRLPWKTLGIPDLRDANGERLWYAISNNFKNNTRTPTLNSDTVGTITVRDSAGNIAHNGCAVYGLPRCPNPGSPDAAFGTGALAVVIAPGGVLTRLGNSVSQDRSASGINVAGNYLDIATISGVTHDNQNFTDSSSVDGFINGGTKIYEEGSNSHRIILNDRILVITRDNVMPLLERRVIGEVKQCLNEYANNNNGRYPWATPLTDLTYQDSSDLLFGRIPDNLNQSYVDSGLIMNFQWEAGCNTHNNITASSWWKSWREMVFYGLADAYKPLLNDPVPVANVCSAANACLSINPPAATADKQFIVIIAGKMLPAQNNRPSNKSSLDNYLEAPNSSGASPFAQNAASATFNDSVIFQ